jgi:hypothetical protein
LGGTVVVSIVIATTSFAENADSFKLKFGDQQFENPSVASQGAADQKVEQCVDIAIDVAKRLGLYYDGSRSREGIVTVRALWNGEPVTLKMKFFRKNMLDLYIASSLEMSGDAVLHIDEGQKIERAYYGELMKATNDKIITLYGDPHTVP